MVSKRFNKLEKFFIVNNVDKMSIEEIAREVKATPERVQDYLKNLKRKEDREIAASEPEIVAPNVSRIRTDDLMGKKRGAVIMTEGASMLGDETRQKKSVYENPAIHRIRD